MIGASERESIRRGSFKSSGISPPVGPGVPGRFLLLADLAAASFSLLHGNYFPVSASCAGTSTGLSARFFRGFLETFLAGLGAFFAGFFASFLATSFAISLANFFTNFLLAAIGRK